MPPNLIDEPVPSALAWAKSQNPETVTCASAVSIAPPIPAVALPAASPSSQSTDSAETFSASVESVPADYYEGSPKPTSLASRSVSHSPIEEAMPSSSPATTEKREALLEKGTALAEDTGDEIAATAGKPRERAGHAVDEIKEVPADMKETVTDPKNREALLEKGKDLADEARDEIQATAGKAAESAREAVNDLRDRAKAFREGHKAKAEADRGAEPAQVEPPKSKLSLRTRMRHLGEFLEAGVNGDKAKADDERGFRYSHPPRDADDFTRLSGIGAGHVGLLNGLGVYKFRQLAGWTDTNIQAVTGEEPLLRAHDLRLWRAEARTVSTRSGYRNAWDRLSDTARSTARFYFKQVPPGFDGEDVEMGPYGATYASPPEVAKCDRLEQITGISPETALQLNRIGIYRFQQIASWSIIARRNIVSRLELPASANLQNWVDQAMKRTR